MDFTQVFPVYLNVFCFRPSLIEAFLISPNLIEDVVPYPNAPI